MKIKSALIKIHWLLSSQFGLDPLLLLRSLFGLPIYLRNWVAFRKGYPGKMKFMPCLHDRYEEGGAIKSEYFWQDLLVARAIYAAKPLKHVDIGSRVDGFAAHVASFREIVFKALSTRYFAISAIISLSMQACIPVDTKDYKK